MVYTCSNVCKTVVVSTYVFNCVQNSSGPYMFNCVWNSSGLYMFNSSDLYISSAAVTNNIGDLVWIASMKLSMYM